MVTRSDPATRAGLRSWGGTLCKCKNAQWNLSVFLTLQAKLEEVKEVRNFRNYIIFENNKTIGIIFSSCFSELNEYNTLMYFSFDVIHRVVWCFKYYKII